MLHRVHQLEVLLRVHPLEVLLQVHPDADHLQDHQQKQLLAVVDHLVDLQVVALQQAHLEEAHHQDHQLDLLAEEDQQDLLAEEDQLDLLAELQHLQDVVVHLPLQAEAVQAHQLLQVEEDQLPVEAVQAEVVPEHLKDHSLRSP